MTSDELYLQWLLKPMASKSFWVHVNRSSDVNACWPWTAFLSSRGYGRYWIPRAAGLGQKYYPAHVVAWELHNQRLFPRPLLGLHSCDNPPCCNPLHIRPGTTKDNAEDARRSGSLAIGSRIYGAKLTDESVAHILAGIAAGDSQSFLAAQFGVRPCTISSIARGLRWRHIPRPTGKETT